MRKSQSGEMNNQKFEKKKGKRNDYSSERYDEWAEEIKKDDNKPYDFISQKVKNEVVSKHKNKEKVNPNWIHESESGNTLSYSKVFNTSSREYVKIWGPDRKKRNWENEERELQDTRDICSRKLIIYLTSYYSSSSGREFLKNY